MTTSHDSSSHGLTLVRALLVTFSLIATFVFLLGMGSGVTALLFAVGGCLTQLATLLFMPDRMLLAWSNGRLVEASLCCVALVLVVLVSVVGSASILSALVDEQGQIAQRRDALQQMATARLESANRLIALDRISKAQPLLDEHSVLLKQAEALPSPSGFYVAAVRIGGEQAQGLITGVIVVLSLLLDGVALLLGLNHRASVASDDDHPTVYRVLPADEYQDDLLAVREAIEAGDMKTVSVRNVRAALGCSQQKAMEIARLCRAADQELSLM